MRRTLAICAAVLFVGAFALATFEPLDASLGSLLHQLNAGVLGAIHAALMRYGVQWMWDWVVWPVLMRPAWLLPAAGGILCAGGAVSLALAGDARPTRRWRG